MIVPQKRCTRCGESKPLTDFNPNPVALDGYWNKCRICIRYRRVPDAEYFQNIQAGLLYCFKCSQWKQPEEMVKQSKGYLGRGSRCFVCHRKVSNDYAARNKPKILATGNAWRKANRTHHLETRRAWRAAHPEKARASYQRFYDQNTEAMRERARAYGRRFPYKVRAANNRRRARLKGNGGDFTADEWKAMCAFYDNRCLRCREKKVLTVDHVVPVSKGGRNDILNIQPLCRSCNTSKGTRNTDYRKPGDMKRFFRQATLFD